MPEINRLDMEKRLDIALEIAKNLPNMTFDIYGTRVLDKKVSPILQALQKLQNVRLCGRYDGFSYLYPIILRFCTRLSVTDCPTLS